MAGLDLWVDLALSLDDNLQDVFVKVSQELERTQDVDRARDMLWAETSRVHSIIVGAQLQERLQSSYKDLYGYGQDSYTRFDSTMEALKKKERELFKDLLTTTQNLVFSYRDKLAGYEPAELGNRLRDISKQSQATSDARVARGTAAVSPVSRGIDHGARRGPDSRSQGSSPSAGLDGVIVTSVTGRNVWLRRRLRR